MGQLKVTCYSAMICTLDTLVTVLSCQAKTCHQTVRLVKSIVEASQDTVPWATFCRNAEILQLSRDP